MGQLYSTHAGERTLEFGQGKVLYNGSRWTNPGIINGKTIYDKMIPEAIKPTYLSTDLKHSKKEKKRNGNCVK